MENEQEKKKQKKKVLFIGLGTITTGVLGFFGWQYWKDHKDAKKMLKQNNASTNTNSGNNNTYTPKTDSTPHKESHHPTYSNDGFPLQKGSRGTKVKAFQQALIAKYGASILPRWGADGDFGSETAAGLQKAGLPSVIDSSTYYALVGGSSNTNTSNSGGSLSDDDAKSISKSLHDAIDNSKPDDAIKALQRMNSTDDYSKVNTEFKKTDSGWVSKTIVNGLLDAFTDESQKVKIRLEFTRMGLKYDGNKFSLSGIPYLLITKINTEVYEKDGKAIEVKKDTLLGHPVGIRNEWVYFFSFNKHILLRVKKEHVTIHKNNNQE